MKPAEVIKSFSDVLEMIEKCDILSLVSAFESINLPEELRKKLQKVFEEKPNYFVELLTKIKKKDLSYVSSFLQEEVAVKYRAPTQNEIDSYLKKMGEFQLVTNAHSVELIENFASVIGLLSTIEIDPSKIFSWKDSEGKTVIWHAANQENSGMLTFLLQFLRPEHIEEVDFYSCMQLAVQKGNPTVVESFLSCDNKIVTSSSRYKDALQEMSFQALNSDQKDLLFQIINHPSEITKNLDYRRISNALLQKIVSMPLTISESQNLVNDLSLSSSDLEKSVTDVNFVRSEQS